MTTQVSNPIRNPSGYNGRNSLSDFPDVISQIQAYYDTGKTLRQTATHFNLDRSTITKHVKVRPPKVPSPDRLKQREYVRNLYSRYRTTKRRIIDQLGGKCVSCGYSKHIDNLHFIPKHNSNKSLLTIIQRKYVAMKKMLAAAKRCHILCSNCKREHNDGMLDIP